MVCVACVEQCCIEIGLWIVYPPSISVPQVHEGTVTASPPKSKCHLAQNERIPAQPQAQALSFRAVAPLAAI